MDRTYRDVRNTQFLLFGCCAMLAGIMLIVAVYLFNRGRTSTLLSQRGVRTEAVLDSTDGDYATVTFTVNGAPRTETIDRIGAQLCPSAEGLRHLGGCGPVAGRPSFVIVYDPQDPARAQPADVVGAGSDRTAAEVSAVLAAVLVALAAGRWRWLRQVTALHTHADTAPRETMLVSALDRRPGRVTIGGMRMAPVKATLEGADGARLRVVLSDPGGALGNAPASTVTVTGRVAPGGAVTVSDGEATAWPMRKARRPRRKT